MTSSKLSLVLYVKITFVIGVSILKDFRMEAYNEV